MTLTQAETHPTTMMKDFHTLTQAGTHPTTMMNDSHPGQNSSYHNDERFHALTTDLVGTESYTLVKWPPVPN